jgi:NAD-dependent DNA ligase
MSSSNIFGRGFSDKKIELVLDDIPDIMNSTKSKEKKIQLVSDVKGMSKKTAESFIEKIELFKEFLKECGLEDKLKEEVIKPPIDGSNPLFNKNIVMTGTRDKTIIDYLKNVGANQSSSVSKNTFLVIVKDKEDDTGKAEDARKLNIPIVSVEEFISKYVSVNL